VSEPTRPKQKNEQKVEQKYIDYWKAQQAQQDARDNKETGAATEIVTAPKSSRVEQKYIDYWKAKQAEQDAQIKVWEQEAWAEAENAAKILCDQFNVTKVIVFGSLVRDRFGEDSDIDIAVEGLSAQDFFTAWCTVERHCTREIDLKPMEKLEPRFKSRVLETGKVIYEKK